MIAFIIIYLLTFLSNFGMMNHLKFNCCILPAAQGFLVPVAALGDEIVL